jgi:Ca-activated chloride channel homolog
MQALFSRSAFLASILFLFAFALSMSAVAQSRPQRPDPSKGEGKRNQRPIPKTEEELKKEEEERKRLEEEKKAVEEPGVAVVETDIVNVDAVVFNKKTGQIITGLKKENFAIFENGVKQTISSFTTPEAPITVSLVLEYSKWTETFGQAGGGGYFEPGVYESVRPVAQFLSKFIKPPGDFASVIAFDLRPAVITDFTNDPARIHQTIDLLLRNSPAFRENNLYDAMKFSLIGGNSESDFVDGAKNRSVAYGGMVDVKSKRKAIILVASGIDTFSKINFGEIRKIVQEGGVPIYIISTGNLFCKKYCDYLDPSRVMPGTPDRMSFLTATNQLKTFAKDSGGAYYEMTFPSEIPSYLNNINAFLRSQYSLAYDIEVPHEAGKKYKLEVKVDVDGDGTYEDKTYVVQHRPFVTAPKTVEPKLKN